LGEIAGRRFEFTWVYFLNVTYAYGFTVPVVYFQGLISLFRAIPVSLTEAAEIDGSSDFRTFRSVVLPLSGPPLITLTIVNLLWAWNELLLALVFLQSDDKKTLMVGITGFQSRYSLSIPTIMAGMTIATLPLFITYIFGQRYFITDLTAGSVKGE